MSTEPEIRWEDTEEFKFPVYSGKVIKVYDGDTITIASKMPYDNSPLYRFHVRLNGIDSPEIKGKNPDEKNVAKLAKEFVSSLVLQKTVTLENIQNDKYGRILADVYFEGKHINNLLINERLAVKYDGGKKIGPASWTKFNLTGDML
jgi:endonuclease YncB( thermonuclease family)